MCLAGRARQSFLRRVAGVSLTFVDLTLTSFCPALLAMRTATKTRSLTKRTSSEKTALTHAPGARKNVVTDRVEHVLGDDEMLDNLS